TGTIRCQSCFSVFSLSSGNLALEEELWYHFPYSFPLEVYVDKLLFVKYSLSLRASAHTGVAIPRLNGTG
ncbi:MAG: hypothetical protein SPI15_11535, partial [Candidatus Faecousia sp.]|nr:hypothetical protein [Candidatus Faecousia sp.]